MFETVLQQDQEILLKIFNKRDFSRHKNLIQSKKFVFKLQNEKESVKKTLLDQNQVKYQYNHIAGGHQFCDKKLLYYNLKKYCELVNLNVFDYMPVTFHIKNSMNIHIDASYIEFARFYKNRQQGKRLKPEMLQDKSLKNIYIIKPGEETNRGRGICLESELEQIQFLLKRT